MQFSHYIQYNNSFYFLMDLLDTYYKYILFYTVVLAIPRRRSPMPYVTDVSDSEEILTPPADDALPAPPTTPPGQHTPSLLAYFNSLITLARRARARRERHVMRGTGEFELPLDTLARKHPYIFIKTMSG
jgi:hypothetical protein